MTPYEQIREGIKTGNLQLVADGYYRISNERIQPAHIVPVTSDRVILQGDPSDPIQETTKRRGRPKKEKQKETAQGEKPKKACKVEPFEIKKRVNKFKDDGKLAAELKAETAKHRKDKRTERPKPYKPTKAQCNTCEKYFEVNPILAASGYCCDKCASRK